MNIRKAKESDLEAIRDLLDGEGLCIYDLESYLSHFLVAERESDLAGTVGFEPYGRIGLLRSLCVRKDERRRGIASRLMEALEAQARKADIEMLYLLTIDQEAYFAKKGYEPVARSDVPDEIRSTREFAEFCPESSTVMIRTIT
ncbi:MAG: arsenic resistance N-acetyltransferase ArsN2 [Planctomycetota bacterium]|jgi:amino-acid N-acetyltransferase